MPYGANKMWITNERILFMCVHYPFLRQKILVWVFEHQNFLEIWVHYTNGKFKLENIGIKWNKRFNTKQSYK